MTQQEISNKLKQKFPEAILEIKIEGVVDPYIKISPSNLKDIALYLRDDPDFQFDFLMCLSGMDYTKGTLGVVYNIFSMKKKHKVNLKVDVPKDKAEVPSVSSVWPAANWHEREAYDLIGVKFLDHPDLRRILMPDDWDGHPLQKDYKVPEYYQGMKVPY